MTATGDLRVLGCKNESVRAPWRVNSIENGRTCVLLSSGWGGLEQQLSLFTPPKFQPQMCFSEFPLVTRFGLPVLKLLSPHSEKGASLAPTTCYILLVTFPKDELTKGQLRFIPQY